MAYTLITGVTSGIGLALSEQFASKGHNLVLVARRMEALKEVSEHLKSAYPDVKIESIVMDLAEEDVGRRLLWIVSSMNYDIDVLINNAGIGFVGKFEDVSIESYEEMMHLNMNALCEITHAFIPMLKKNHGAIINVASNGAFHPGPYTANYYATKAYVLHLTKALRMELKKDGVRVSALCPGATVSDFCRKAGKRQIKGSMSAEDVAKSTYQGFKKNKAVIIPGFFNKLVMVCPTKLRSYAIYYSQQKLSEQKD